MCDENEREEHLRAHAEFAFNTFWTESEQIWKEYYKFDGPFNGVLLEVLNAWELECAGWLAHLREVLLRAAQQDAHVQAFYAANIRSRGPASWLSQQKVASWPSS